VWNHGSSAFNELIHVPLVMAAPGLVPAGKHIDACTRHIDVVPTIIDLLGLQSPPTVQGRSLRPLLDGESMEPVPAYTEVYPLRPEGCSITSLVDGKHKIIHVALGDSTATLLYNLEADPGEQNDLAKGRPQLCRSLEDALFLWDDVAHHYDPGSDTIPLDAWRLKLLRSLGYVN
jgi:arylsulfatase A-like enzyme